MRERVIEISEAYEPILHEYDGDASALEAADDTLRALLTPQEPPLFKRWQKWVLAGVAVVLLACTIGVCLVGRNVWQSTRVVPTLAAYVATEAARPTATPPPTATATATSTATPTATPTATSTTTPTATATATATPTATATSTATPTAMPTATPTLRYAGAVMTGSVYVRQGPGLEYDLLGMVLTRGQAIEVVAVYGTWVQARWTPQSGAEVVGWVPMTWVGALTPFPEQIITPTSVP
jgi:cytoskeletal protein RodZ